MPDRANFTMCAEAKGASTTAARRLERSMPRANKSGSNEGTAVAAEQSSSFLHLDSTTAPMTSTPLRYPVGKTPSPPHYAGKHELPDQVERSNGGRAHRTPSIPLAQQ